MIDPEAVRDRWLQLSGEAEALAELRNRCFSQAVSERTVPFSWYAYTPRPFPREMAGEDLSRGPGRSDTRLGVDTQGRAVYQQLRDDLFVLYHWSDDRCEVVEVNGDLRKLEVLAFRDGRLVEEMSTSGYERLDGRPTITVVSWTYDQGRPEMAFKTYESGSDPAWGPPHWEGTAYGFAYDAEGQLESIIDRSSDGALADGHDAEAAQAAAVSGFPHRYGEPRSLFDARTQRRETDLPEPKRAYEGLSEGLADALYAAIAAQRAALGPLEFVLVAPRGWVSKAVAADASFVDRVSAMGLRPAEAFRVAFDQPAGTIVVDAIDTAPPDVLQRLRAGRQALAESYGSTAPEDLGRELMQALHRRDWGNVAPTFVVLAPPTQPDTWLDHDDCDDCDDEDDEIDISDEELLEIFNEEVERLDPSLSREQILEALRKHIQPGLEASPAPEPPRPTGFADLEAIVGPDRVRAFLARLSAKAEPPADDLAPPGRGELATLLAEAAGLTPDEAERVATDALWGILLEPEGAGISRLGGSAVLPVDQAWPRADGRPLTHLATIAMDELPNVEGREHLPPDGLLSFFADTSEEGEFYEPVQPDVAWGHDLVAVIHTPPGTVTEEVTPPGEALVERRVTPTARLQLRHLGFGSGERLFGIDALAEHAIERLTERVNGRVQHQLLGHPWPVQDDPREPGQIVLFHIADDPALDFSFIDAGDIHYLGTPEDIRNLRWDRLTVWPNSC